jgi:hypothetical protein
LPAGGNSGRLPGFALAVADQVGAAHGLQGFAQQRPVFRVVVAQEGLVQFALAAAAHHRHAFPLWPAAQTFFSGFFSVWYMAVASAIGVGRKVCTWSRRKPLRFSQSARFQHVLVGGAGVGGDEVGDQVLLLARLPSRTSRTSA